jgi:hypothetical protein
MIDLIMLTTMTLKYLQILNNVIINKTKVLLPQVTLAGFGYPLVLLILLPKH